MNRIKYKVIALIWLVINCFLNQFAEYPVLPVIHITLLSQLEHSMLEHKTYFYDSNSSLHKLNKYVHHYLLYRYYALPTFRCKLIIIVRNFSWTSARYSWSFLPHCSQGTLLWVLFSLKSTEYIYLKEALWSSSSSCSRLEISKSSHYELPK